MIDTPRSSAIAAMAFFMCAAAAIPASAQQEQAPGDVLSAGKADFMTYCAVCHGADAKGEGPVAKTLSVEPADLTVLSKNNGGTLPEERVHMIVDGRQEVTAHGTRDMPVWGNWFKFVARAGFTDEVDEDTAEIIVALRIQGVIEYLRSIQQK